MAGTGRTTFVEFIYNDKTPFSGKKYEYLKSESKEFLVTPLKIMSLLIAVSGLFAMIFEVRYFSEYSFHVYFTRLGATLASFIILVILYSKKGLDRPIALVHMLLLVIIISSGYMIYLIPSTLVVNAQIMGLMIFTSALFLSWDVKNQIIVAIYYNVVFASAILLNDNTIYFLPNMFESVLFVLFLSVVSVIGSAVNYRLRTQIAEKNYILEISEKKYRSIFDNSADGIFQSTPDGSFITVNPALVKILGYDSAEELLKVKLTDEIYQNPEAREKLTGELKEKGVINNYRMILKRKDRSDVMVMINALYVTDDDENKKYFEGTIKDITAQVRAEEKQRRAEEALREEKRKSDILAKEALESSIIKSQFLANMSHEIRTPMNGIIGFLTLIEKSAYKSQDEMMNFVSSARNSAESLLDIINDILDLSKIESGKMQLQDTDFNLSEVIDEAVDMLSPKAEEKHLQISKFIYDDTPLLLTGDSLRLRQVILNLLSNAIKFTEKGDISISAKLREFLNDKVSVQISVQDSGIGIPKQKLDSLFKPFSQVDGSHTRKYGGTGLGLVICKEFIHMMGGEITVESESNKGSRFIFTVKMKLQKIIKPGMPGQYSKLYNFKKQSRQDLAGSPEMKAIRSKFKILLAEDNIVNKKVALKILTESGYLADSAMNGYEAVKAVSNNNYDLILMDVQMPEMDGFMATQEIRKMNNEISNIPIIAITAHALAGDREKCIEAGMNDYISKPIIAEHMIKVIDKWMKITNDPNTNIEEEKNEVEDYFDFTHLDKMSAGDKNFQKELAATFIEDVNQRFDKLASLIFKRDVQKVINEAHTIKGAAFSIGAVCIGNVAKEIEVAAKDNNLHLAADKLKDLKDALIQTERLLKVKL
ncbi:MAG: ATP-binding protein [Ignavibacteriaceae bacterium]